MSAVAGSRRTEPAARTDSELRLQSSARDLRDRRPTSLGFVTKPGVKVVWELNRRALHGYASISTTNPLLRGRVRRDACAAKITVRLCR